MLIRGTVLAAGLSRRMGFPKALIEIGGETLLARAARVMRDGGVGEVVAVVSDEIEGRARSILGDSAAVVVNETPESEMISSVIIAAEIEPPPDAVIILPVDIPLRDSGVIRRLITAAEGSRPIVVPAHDGRRGHPILIKREVFSLLSEDLPEGIRTLLSRPDLVTEVEIGGSPPYDLDTPEDLSAFMADGG